MAVKIQVEVFWVVTPCCVVVGYCNIIRHHNPEDLDLNLSTFSPTLTKQRHVF